MAGLRQVLDGSVTRWTSCDESTIEISARSLARSRRETLNTEGTQAALARAIEAEIIPRLMMAHKVTSAVPKAQRATCPTPGSEDVLEFTRIVLAHDAGVAVSYVDVLRAQGVTLETIFLELLAPTARYLGELWEADICDFTDVTIALSRIQQLLRELSPEFDDGIALRPSRRRALLVAMPGDQHSLGVFIVEQFFRRAGWDVRSATPHTSEELIATIRDEPFDILGVSVSRDVLLDELASVIRTVRKVTRNAALGVLVGGRSFIEHPEFVARVGADATALDGRQAILQLPVLLDLTAKRC